MVTGKSRISLVLAVCLLIAITLAVSVSVPAQAQQAEFSPNLNMQVMCPDPNVCVYKVWGQNFLTLDGAIGALQNAAHTVCSTDYAPATGKIFPVWRAPGAATLIGAHYLLAGATSLAGQVQICNSNNASCQNTQATDVTALTGTDSDNGTLTFNTIAGGTYVSAKETTLTGSSPISYTVCIDYNF